MLENIFVAFVSFVSFVIVIYVVSFIKSRSKNKVKNSPDDIFNYFGRKVNE